MNKQVIKILIVAICFLVLAGCGTSGKDDKTIYEIGEAGTWVDGTYSESAT